MDANALLDTWDRRFDLGRAYLEAGAFTQADSEFDRCIKRRGEPGAVLGRRADTGLFPPVYYYQGRVLEKLGSNEVCRFMRIYLGIRGQSNEDALAQNPDVALTVSLRLA